MASAVSFCDPTDRGQLEGDGVLVGWTGAGRAVVKVRVECGSTSQNGNNGFGAPGPWRTPGAITQL